MNTNTLPPEDDLDRMLSAYFKRQMPAEWPVCRATATLAEPTSVRPALQPAASQPARSSLTLAASVAALLGLGLYLSSDHQPGTAPVANDNSKLLNSGNADGKNLLKHIKPTPAPKP